MYNGIGLQTPRGSGTNGYVTRNLSAVRKTKEKVPEYKTKEDAAVRPYDADLIEHERRRQAEVRCMELRELLEEDRIPEAEIEEKVNAFRAKLLAEKKLAVAKDASGRAMVKDSHELSMAQESKNERAKDAFGIRTDFIPGSSFEAKQASEKSAASTSSKDTITEPSVEAKVSSKHEDRSRKRKKSKKSSKRSSSSSSSSSSSDEEEKRKKRKKDRKKKSKKSHHHRREDEDSPDVRRRSRHERQ